MRCADCAKFGNFPSCNSTCVAKRIIIGILMFLYFCTSLLMLFMRGVSCSGKLQVHFYVLLPRLSQFFRPSHTDNEVPQSSLSRRPAFHSNMRLSVILSVVVSVSIRLQGPKILIYSLFHSVSPSFILFTTNNFTLVPPQTPTLK